MSTRHFFVASSILFLTSAVALAAAQPTFYVAPGGSDANPGTEAKPFATLEKARQAVRAINKDMTGDIVVVLRGGVYRIDNTVAFDAEDSGANGHNVIYRLRPAKRPSSAAANRSSGGSRTKRDAGRRRPRSTISASCTWAAFGPSAPGAKKPAGLELVGRRRLQDHGRRNGPVEESRRSGILLRGHLGPHALQGAEHQAGGGPGGHHHAPAVFRPGQGQRRREYRQTRPSSISRTRWNCSTSRASGISTVRPRRSTTCRGPAKT